MRIAENSVLLGVQAEAASPRAAAREWRALVMQLVLPGLAGLAIGDLSKHQAFGLFAVYVILRPLPHIIPGHTYLK